jgi:hypothetical protein
MTDQTAPPALIPQAAEALEATVRLTGLSRTDVTNRALQFYEFVESERAAGSDFFVRRRDGTMLLVVIGDAGVTAAEVP